MTTNKKCSKPGCPSSRHEVEHDDFLQPIGCGEVFDLPEGTEIELSDGCRAVIDNGYKSGTNATLTQLPSGRAWEERPQLQGLANLPYRIVSIPKSEASRERRRQGDTLYKGVDTLIETHEMTVALVENFTDSEKARLVDSAQAVVDAILTNSPHLEDRYRDDVSDQHAHEIAQLLSQLDEAQKLTRKVADECLAIIFAAIDLDKSISKTTKSLDLEA